MLCPLTSFIAIEERSATHVASRATPSIEELAIPAENLPAQDWDGLAQEEDVFMFLNSCSLFKQEFCEPIIIEPESPLESDLPTKPATEPSLPQPILESFSEWLSKLSVEQEQQIQQLKEQAIVPPGESLSEWLATLESTKISDVKLSNVVHEPAEEESFCPEKAPTSMPEETHIQNTQAASSNQETLASECTENHASPTEKLQQLLARIHEQGPLADKKREFGERYAKMLLGMRTPQAAATKTEIRKEEKKQQKKEEKKEEKKEQREEECSCGFDLFDGDFGGGYYEEPSDSGFGLFDGHSSQKEPKCEDKPPIHTETATYSTGGDADEDIGGFGLFGDSVPEKPGHTLATHSTDEDGQGIGFGLFDSDSPVSTQSTGSGEHHEPTRMPDTVTHTKECTSATLLPFCFLPPSISAKPKAPNPPTAQACPPPPIITAYAAPAASSTLRTTVRPIKQVAEPEMLPKRPQAVTRCGGGANSQQLVLNILNTFLPIFFSD